MPETVIVADEVEGTFVDSNGEGKGEEGEAGGVRRDARSRKRVKEVEELSFVPSAISVPPTKKCQKCYNESLKAKGENTLTNVQWREFAEQKAHHGRLMYVECGFRRERDGVNMFREQHKEETCRNTRPVAVGIASQRTLGTSKTP